MRLHLQRGFRPVALLPPLHEPQQQRVQAFRVRRRADRLPSLDALKKIATTLHVSTDFLLFDEHERGPDGELALQFEAISQLPENEQAIVREVLESLIIKYQSRRWDSARKAVKEES